ncbi:MAG TPA: hypothetical protein VGO11_05280 [Chthoniobacteraceae bacterium]|nr:hypothetical protein [Chthoniobacteraceae bacterium]
MFLRLSRVLVLLAAVQILGGHWAALQTAAWIGMVANYTQTDSLGAAIAKTFDGAHPCVLCTVVKKGQAEEQKQEPVKIVLKTEAVLPPIFAVPPPRSAPWKFVSVSRRATARTLSPPTPPPLAA